MRKIFCLSIVFLIAGCSLLNQREDRKPAAEACEFYLSTIKENFLRASDGEFGYQARNGSICDGDFEANLAPIPRGEVLSFEIGQLSLSQANLKFIVPDSRWPSGSISLHIRSLPRVSLNYRLDATFKDAELSVGTRAINALSIQSQELGLYAWTQSNEANRLVYIPVRYPNQKSNVAVLSIGFVSQKEVKFRLISKSGQANEWKSLNLEDPQDSRSARKISISLDPQNAQELSLELAVDGKKVSDFWLYLPKSN